MPDLGLSHELLTGLCSRPESPESWLAVALSAQRVADFERDGFVFGVPLLDQRQCDVLCRELDEMARPDHDGREFWYEYNSNEAEDPGRRLFHALGAWRVRPAFHDLAFHPRLAMAAHQLLGGGVRFFHDQLFSKPARDGGCVSWHQDYSYWTWTAPMAHLTAWIALDDVDESNGCLRYVPGSHRWGLLERKGLSGEMDAIAEQLSEGQRAALERSVPVCMPRGHVSFHHPLLVHGSFENDSDRPRRATLVNVFADGVKSSVAEGAHPGTNDYPFVPRGEPMGGAYYPLLFDPDRELGDASERVTRLSR